jgi:hypothetical protein
MLQLICIEDGAATVGYEKFLKGKEINKNGKQLFDKTLKKATKQRGSKWSQTLYLVQA